MNSRSKVLSGALAKLALRKRWVQGWNALYSGLFWCSCGAAALFLLERLLSEIVGSPSQLAVPSVAWLTVAVIGGLSLLWGLLLALLLRLSPLLLAKTADDRNEWRDLLGSAYLLARDPSARSPFVTAAIDRAVQASAQLDVRNIFPFPKPGMRALFPLALLLLVWVCYLGPREEPKNFRTPSPVASLFAPREDESPPPAEGESPSLLAGVQGLTGAAAAAAAAPCGLHVQNMPERSPQGGSNDSSPGGGSQGSPDVGAEHSPDLFGERERTPSKRVQEFVDPLFVEEGEERMKPRMVYTGRHQEAGGAGADEDTYRYLYRQYERRAERILRHETIPESARETVRRYFDGIRPR